MLFGEDYLKFRNFLNIGWFLFIEGTVVRSNWGQQNLEFKIRNIDLLNEIGLKRSKIEDVCQEFSGNTPLFLKVWDEQENISLELMSRRFRVNPVNDMVRKMRKVADVEVRT
jgi:DNA polymerase-3 subunit alpha